ncbi:MAG: quinone-interacting membrane-bound oxidoreductase complex subunit QmoC [Thermodesulfovibrionales bacterium]|nr:quinone-interacting membrane-bound oxidoreductase complex subunit QmoC [Thermodesulfovibrionales bacterium]
MAEIIKPDLRFVKEVIKAGGTDLKKCYQCSTCTAVCNVTQDKKPFPRKEMLYAQWGLKDKLFSNPDIWLCHQCSDCTAYCPRGAKPGEVLGAIRKLAIQEHSWPGFLGKMVGNPLYLIFLLAVPVIILLIGAHGNPLDPDSIPRGEDGSIVYAKFMPINTVIDPIFIAAAAFAVVSFIMGVKKYWNTLKAAGYSQGSQSLSNSIVNTLKEILLHRQFTRCNVTKTRTYAHLLTFYAFIGLAITTSWAVVYLYGYEIFGIQPFGIFHFGESPYPLYDPVKILGNISGLALITGITLIVLFRLINAPKAGIGSYFDWLLIAVIYIIAVTGILSQVLRLADIASLAYPVYFLHLTFVFFLFAYAPFSKMAHMVYRTVAMVFARHNGITPKELIERKAS